ncbi:hypothetical protein DFH01_27500 [Falsiroseomonas bella]|uniref:Uncharacterized protein n=1 Tax=Falsiroseomonas bella TaxID=2184016 RepID=A0A317F4J9_9PROT|nr:hypothetical protein [Falsiroseomonas bella]PWS34074.1 hypothetical protein DFH01_27500 [Falsiroseomonas bella]
MRRLSLLLPLLMPLPAEANEAFCPALKRLVAAAQWGFNDIGLAPHLIPGSIAERRGVTRVLDGPERGAIFATMLRTESREHAAEVRHRFDALRGEIGHCLSDAQASPVSGGQGGQQAHWTMPYAVVRLRADGGDGFASTSEVEITVAARW